MPRIMPPTMSPLRSACRQAGGDEPAGRSVGPRGTSVSVSVVAQGSGGCQDQIPAVPASCASANESRGNRNVWKAEHRGITGSTRRRDARADRPPHGDAIRRRQHRLQRGGADQRRSSASSEESDRPTGSGRRPAGAPRFVQGQRAQGSKMAARNSMMSWAAVSGVTPVGSSQGLTSTRSNPTIRPFRAIPWRRSRASI